MSRVVIATVLGLSVAAAAPASADQKGREVAKKVDEMFVGYEGERADVELVLITSGGQKTVRKMNTQLRENREVDKMIITLAWPADVKGVRLLTWAHREKTDDQWLFMPSINRTKRISARGRTGSFLGSEFTYEDLSRPMQLEKFSFKFLRDQQVGKRKTWVVEAIPNDKYSGYSKQKIWVDQEYQLPLRIEYWDRKGKLLKVQSYKKFKKYKGKWWRPDYHEMANKQNGKKSLIVYKTRSLVKPPPPERFSPSAIASQ